MRTIQISSHISAQGTLVSRDGRYATIEAGGRLLRGILVGAERPATIQPAPAS